MDLLHHLYSGFGVALTAQNILYCAVGVLFGQMIGVLPGIARPRPSRCFCRSPFR